LGSEGGLGVVNVRDFLVFCSHIPKITPNNKSTAKNHNIRSPLVIASAFFFQELSIMSFQIKVKKC
jgi:hypothetical protein